MSERNYWVYILTCDNGTYYTGYTTDLVRRFNDHVSGAAKCKYTRSFKPLAISQSWRIEGDKAAAMRVERAIKKLSRHEKEQLIMYPEGLADLI